MVSAVKRNQTKTMENEVIIPPSEDFMNPPVDYDWTEEDIVNEFKKTGNKKSVSKIYLISISDVTKTLKKHKLL